MPKGKRNATTTPVAATSNPNIIQNFVQAASELGLKVETLAAENAALRKKITDLQTVLLGGSRTAEAAPAPVPAKAPKAPKAPKAAKAPKKTRAPRANGEKLTFKDKIRIVMGRQVMSAGEVVGKLEEKGWLPESNNPQQYVSTVLGSTKDMFERVPEKGRGYYRAMGRNQEESVQDLMDRFPPDLS